MPSPIAVALLEPNSIVPDMVDDCDGGQFDILADIEA
jgi:hypothetical protein